METLLSRPSLKRQVALAAALAGVTHLGQLLEDRRPGLRIVNLHAVPARFADAFGDLLARLRRRFDLVDPGELPAMLTRLPTRPSLLVAFDDGLRSTVEHGAAAVEAAGGRAVFAIPAGWPDVAPAEQAAWFAERVYPISTELHDHEGDVEAPTWDELRALVTRGHAVWSHGYEHVELDPTTCPAVLEREIITSRHRLEQALGMPVEGFCPPVSVARLGTDAERLIRSTYTYAFAGTPGPLRAPVDRLRLGRTNIEASWEPSVIDFQLSPLGDKSVRSRGRGPR